MQEFTFKMFDDGTYVAASYEGDEWDVVIPATHQGKPVTILYDSLFADHPEITSVKIPDTVTDIGGFVFDGCINLKEIELPDSVTNLWQYAFVRCGITKIKLPDNVRSIPPFTFKDCADLTEIRCGKGMKKIYAWAFEGCDKLTTIDHPPGKVDISPLAFEAQ